MYLILLAAVLTLAGIFAVQNEGSQVFHFLRYSWALPTWGPTVIGVGAVSLLLMLAGSYSGLRARFGDIGHGREIEEHRRVINRLRSENARLREELAAAQAAIREVPGSAARTRR